jgi:EAL domain-containing protein (putative c-di-GMP-specific phosphodiesterase class I)
LGKDILVDAASGAIAQTIISLGTALDIPVIAEGLETGEQQRYLAGLGCDSYQGYLFSRALPIREFEEFYKAYRRKHLVDSNDLAASIDASFEI